LQRRKEKALKQAEKRLQRVLAAGCGGVSRQTVLHFAAKRVALCGKMRCIMRQNTLHYAAKYTAFLRQNTLRFCGKMQPHVVTVAGIRMQKKRIGCIKGS